MLNSTYAVAQDKVRIPIDLPTPVRDRIQQAVECGWLDAQFAAMESDDSYRSLQLAIAKEFVLLDREVWQLEKTKEMR